MENKIKKQSQGFTIIEVMIVLAIAALILVVVLIAVPQLQRNQRNSARANDASRVATSAANWSANNKGATVPTSGNAQSVALSLIQNDLGDMAQYTASSAVKSTALTGNGVTVNNLNDLVIVPGAKCGSVSGPYGSYNGAVQGQTREQVVLYATENSSSNAVPQCIQV